MSEGTGSDSRRSSGPRDKSKKDEKTPKGSTSRPRTRAKSSGDLGRALRSVYDSTLSERVPDDFLDLLGKLS